MKYPILNNCPVCGNKLTVTKLDCDNCKTSYNGEFELNNFNYLDIDEKEFVFTFLKCRGNIKEMEKALNISYPTVRNKLDKVINRLGLDKKQEQSTGEKVLSALKLDTDALHVVTDIVDDINSDLSNIRKEILKNLQNGIIDTKTAIKKISKLEK